MKKKQMLAALQIVAEIDDRMRRIGSVAAYGCAIAVTAFAGVWLVEREATRAIEKLSARIDELEDAQEELKRGK
jgi:hypothetical protein